MKIKNSVLYSKLAKCTLFENASANRHCSGGFEAKFYKPESKCELTYSEKKISCAKTKIFEQSASYFFITAFTKLLSAPS